jgi:CheY-like chemotaxis protein
MTPKKRILIVDDDLDLLAAIQIILESQGYTVETATGGKDGFKKCMQWKPNLVILDVMMEHTDEGFRLASVLRDQESTRNLPILMVTAVTQKAGVVPDYPTAAGTWIPVDGFLEKPVPREVLLKRVKELLGA